MLYLAALILFALVLWVIINGLSRRVREVCDPVMKNWSETGPTRNIALCIFDHLKGELRFANQKFLLSNGFGLLARLSFRNPDPALIFDPSATSLFRQRVSRKNQHDNGKAHQNKPKKKPIAVVQMTFCFHHTLKESVARLLPP